MWLLSAVKGRRVLQIAVAYAVVAWLVVQVIVAVEAPLLLPEWFDTATIVLLATGFPIALIFAWGLHRETPGGAGSSDGERKAEPTSATASVAPPTAAVPKHAIRFCESRDGARIAYSTMGAGKPVIKTANWLSHIELDPNTPVYGHLIRDLAANFQLTIYDERLSGLSDWDAEDVSLDAFVDDLEAVRRAAGLDRFSMLGFSQGCLVSVAYAARYPDRIDRMVLFGGFARNFRTAEGEVEAIATLIEQGWGQENPAFRQIFTTSLIQNATKEELDCLNELMRVSASAKNAAKLFRAIHSIDVRGLAGQVRAPTLVLHCRDEPGVPVEHGRELAALIPGARFVGLPSKNHILLERDEAYSTFKAQVFSFFSADG